PFHFAAGFQLDVGEDALQKPVSLAIPVDPSLKPGTPVWFFRYDHVFGENGQLIPAWMQEDEGVVGTDGFAHTASLPYERPEKTGTWFAGTAEDGTVSKIGVTTETKFPVGGGGTMNYSVAAGGSAIGAFASLDGGAFLTLKTGKVTVIAVHVNAEGGFAS